MKLEIKDKEIIKILDFFHIKAKIIRILIAFLEELFNRMSHNHIFIISAGIAFNILLYLIPLILVALYVVNLSIEEDKVIYFIQDKLNQIIPAVPMLKNFIQDILAEITIIYKKSILFGWIGIISLFWLSSTLSSSLRSGLNTIFHIDTPKVFIVYKFQDILLVIFIAIFMLILFYINPIISIIQTYILQLFPFELQNVFKKIYFFIFSFINSFILLYLLFRLVPNKKMPRKLRVYSIIISMILIEISRNIFAWYISGLSAYGKFYGTYAIIASMALWIYYLTFVLLFSAELGKLIYDLKYGDTIAEYLKTLKISPKFYKVPK